MNIFGWLASAFLVWARVTAHAFFIAAAGLTATALVKAAVRLDRTSILAFGGLLVLALFAWSVTLLIRAARETASEMLLSDDRLAARARLERLLMPVSLGMAAVIAMVAAVASWQTGSSPRRVELPVLVVLGYVGAPFLIRRRIFPRLLERLGVT